MHFNRQIIRKIFLCGLFAGSLIPALNAQNNLYDESRVQDISIRFTEPGWRTTLDSLMKEGDDTTRLIASSISINGKIYSGAGVRFKGFSSWNYGETKNPFNIDLDYLISNKNYQGYKKLRLSNVIHDPSFVREALSYKIAGSYMPASLANFAMLYVNDTLIGLYSNVESVDDRFTEKHFSDANAILLKGSPQKLQFPFGQNANLNFISSTDSLVYTPYYSLVSEYGWEALMHFIDILNNQPDSIPYVLNVDRALWMHAFNYALVNLDSYLGYSQNYYLAMDNNGRFNTIPWDLNMSFGSFRSSDGSTHFNGLSIDQVKKLDPLQHLTFSVTPRPLLKNLIADSTCRKMYMAHLRTIMNDWFSSGIYLQEATKLQALIDTCVLADTCRFYSYQDFLNNLDTTVGGTGGMILYVGIKELMEARLEYLKSVPGYAGQPEFFMEIIDPLPPVMGDSVWFVAGVTGNAEVWLHAKQSDKDIFHTFRMYDDGQHHDGTAGDSLYGAGIMMNGNVLKYFYYAQNDSAGMFFPERAETEFFVYYPDPSVDSLVINEISSTVQLVPGSAPMVTCQWVEFFNRSHDTLSLSNQSVVTDTAWLHPDNLTNSLIPPGGYAVYSINSSPLTTVQYPYVDGGFSGWLGLVDIFTGHTTDSVWVPPTTGNLTWGRYPNGYGDFTLMGATRGARNAVGIPETGGIQLYPNPASGNTVAAWIGMGGDYTLEISDIANRDCIRVMSSDLGEGKEILAELPLDQLSAGVYLVRVIYSNITIQSKLIVK
jgi:hypothetical protein